MAGSVITLAGGVGGAKLALGFSRIMPCDRLIVVVNTGDDEEFHGLYVCPDLDTVMYALSNLTNSDTGWGIQSDTFQTLGMLDRYGSPTWFHLGDKDMATHVRRTELIRQGWSLSQTTTELCRHLGIQHSIAPMSNARVRTIIETSEGMLPFQVYFVKQRCRPIVQDIHFHGADVAVPSPAFDEALGNAEALVFCPSNPFLSIAPILAIKDVRKRVASFRGPRVAVSPIIGGKALRGPAAKMLKELGHEPTSVGVAKQYRGLCDFFVIDETDRDHADAIKSMGMEPHITNTVMNNDADKIALAKDLYQLLDL